MAIKRGPGYKHPRCRSRPFGCHGCGVRTVELCATSFEERGRNCTWPRWSGALGHGCVWVCRIWLGVHTLMHARIPAQIDVWLQVRGRREPWVRIPVQLQIRVQLGARAQGCLRFRVCVCVCIRIQVPVAVQEPGWPVGWFPVLVFGGVVPAGGGGPAGRGVFGGSGRGPGGVVFEVVVFGAGPAEVGDPGGPAVGPGQEVVRVVIQGGVVTARGPPLPEGRQPRSSTPTYSFATVILPAAGAVPRRYRECLLKDPGT